MIHLGRLSLFVFIAITSVAILDTIPIVSAQQITFDFDKLPKFEFAQDSFFQSIAEDVDFGWRIDSIGQDLREAFTFNDSEKRDLKFEHARIQQDKINDLDMRGLPIPLEFEERRIQKINEATEIINKQSRVDEKTVSEFDLLKDMGEFNEIRILYSQLPKVINADQETKDRFNAKVNSLDKWQDECRGDFDIDSLKPLNTAISKLQIQCPKLLEYEKLFGLDRIRMFVSGSI